MRMLQTEALLRQIEVVEGTSDRVYDADNSVGTGIRDVLDHLRAALSCQQQSRLMVRAAGPSNRFDYWYH